MRHKSNYISRHNDRIKFLSKVNCALLRMTYKVERIWVHCKVVFGSGNYTENNSGLGLR